MASASASANADLEIPIPDSPFPIDEVVIQPAKRVANPESYYQVAKRRRLESELEDLNTKQLAKEVEINLVQSKISDYEISIRRIETKMREAQNEKLGLVRALGTINHKIKKNKLELQKS